MNSSFPKLQVRSLVCGQLSQHHAIEVSRTNADIPLQRGGPATVSVVRVTAKGKADLIVAGDVIDSVTGVLDDNLVDEAETDKLMEKLELSYVFCAGVSKDEFKSVCYSMIYMIKVLFGKSKGA